MDNIYHNLCKLHYATIDDIPKHGFIASEILKTRIIKPEQYDWKEFYEGLETRNIRYIPIFYDLRLVAGIYIDFQYSIKKMLVKSFNLLQKKCPTVNLNELLIELKSQTDDKYYSIGNFNESRFLINNMNTEMNNIYTNITTVWNDFNSIHYYIV